MMACVYHNEIYIYISISPIQLQRYVDQAVPVPGVTSDGLLKNKNNIKQLGTEHPLLEPKSIWITWIISQITASLVDSLLFVRRLIDVLSMMCHPPGLPGRLLGKFSTTGTGWIGWKLPIGTNLSAELSRVKWRSPWPIDWVDGW